MRLFALVAILLLGGCASMEKGESALDRIAEDYVRMTLEMGVREPGYVDAYYGPSAWQDAAEASPRSVEALVAEAARLAAELDQVDPTDLGIMERRRRAFLLAQLRAARTRMRMAQGEKLAFAEEAEGLFGVRPALERLSSFDPVLDRIDRLVPGEGPLWSRVDTFQDRFVVPADRLDAVMRAAIDECRRRTQQHIMLPGEEQFTLEFVTGKSWSGYNWYKGDATSLIQINTDLPVRISRAVDLGCHEGYPGHHVFNMLLEERLTESRGWVEFSVYPLYSPQSLIAEGSANYGIDLAFPDEERLKFETEVLYPLAGLPSGPAERYLALQEAMSDLAGARFTIAADYLEGRIDRERAIGLTQQYQLVSRARAEQSIDFVDQYRSYVINYGLGEDMVEAFVEAAGSDPVSRWRAMERVISEPTLPSDLLER